LNQGAANTHPSKNDDPSEKSDQKLDVKPLNEVYTDISFKEFSPEDLKTLISNLFEKRPELKAPVKQKDSTGIDVEGTMKTFYVNFSTKELVIPEGNVDTMPQWVFTATLWKQLYPEGRIYTKVDERPTGLAADQIAHVVRLVSATIGLFAEDGGENDLRPTDSFIAKIFIDQLTKRYKSRFVNLTRQEKLLNLEQFMSQVKNQPIMKGKENTQSYDYIRLWQQLISRLVRFDWKTDKFSDQFSQNFMNNYIKSSIVKETLQEALKENRIKIININTFNDVLFEHESNFIDVLGIETPENYAQFYAKTKSRYDKGDYTVCNDIHRYNKSVRDNICDQGLECLFKRVKARNRVALLKETELHAKRQKIDKFKLPLDVYLSMMNTEELKYFRPLGFTIAADGLCDKYEGTAVTRSCWSYTSNSIGTSQMTKFSFKTGKFNELLDKLILKHYPDRKRKDFSDENDFKNSQSEQEETRKEIKERQLLAAETAISAIEKIYSSVGAIDKTLF
jgi:hypothetical protein